MAIKIVDAEHGRHYKEFIKLPWKIYHRDPYWIPPLRKDVAELLSLKHPFYRHAERRLFLCLKNGEPVGRIAAIVNHRHNEFHGENAGFFGFLEAIRDPEVFSALLRAAEEWVRDKGMEFCRGPVNPNTNEECGMQVDNFTSSPFVMMTFNLPYYPEMLEKAGYTKEKDLFAYFFDAGGGFPDRLKSITGRIRKREKNLVVRPLDMSRFKEELKVVRTIYNEAWEKNWGFVPMTDEELDHMAKKLKPLVVPEMVSFAFIGDEPAGFILSLPDYNQVLKLLNGRLTPLGIIKAIKASRKFQSGRCLTMGVREKFRKKGIESIMFAEVWGYGIRNGYNYGELSWVLEDNKMVHDAVVKIFGAQHYKTYRVYRKDLPVN